MTDVSGPIKPKRGTISSVLTAEAGSSLTVNEVGVVTDVGVIAVASATNSFFTTRQRTQLRRATRHLVGAVNGTALTTLTLAASRLYYIPFIVPRKVNVTGIRVCKTTGAAGTAAVGIYSNTDTATTDGPKDKIVSASIADTTGTGNTDVSVSTTLLPGRIYWAALISSSGSVAVRALALGTTDSHLGWADNSTNVVAGLYEVGSGSTLPATAAASQPDYIGQVPAIYILE